MEAQQFISLSSNALLIAFFLYIVATVFFFISIAGKQQGSEEEREVVKKKWGQRAFVVTIVGFGFQLAYFVLRWIGQGHAPVSNMFEYMSGLAMMAVLGFIIIYALYGMSIIGAFSLPLVVTLLGWSVVFDTDPQPLIPSLQSHWLTLHVITTAIGQGLFAVGFAAGFMYLIRTVDQSTSTFRTKALEWIFISILSLVGFIVLSVSFSAADYEVTFEYINEQGEEQLLTYELPAIAGPYEGEMISEDRMQPWFATPNWMQGVDAPDNFNSVIWAVAVGLVLYAVLRLVLRKRLAAIVQGWVTDLKPSMLDEVTYRAISIAFPIFTLGGLVFAMIWAEEAWGRFWGWDPKEVWALITWLFYAAYLHLRLSKGWHGEKSAWLAVIGFVIILFNLVFVNLVIAGLHSYAS